MLISQFSGVVRLIPAIICKLSIRIESARAAEHVSKVFEVGLLVYMEGMHFQFRQCACIPWIDAWWLTLPEVWYSSDI